MLRSHTLGPHRAAENEGLVSKPGLIETDGTFVPLKSAHWLVWSHKRGWGVGVLALKALSDLSSSHADCATSGDEESGLLDYLACLV